MARRVKLLDKNADVQLVRELFELHEDKCESCQNDRLNCTVRPYCKNRNFLNMLIEIGVNPQDLPSYCYEQYLIQVRRFIKDKKGRNMDDRRIPLKDLLAALKMSSIRQFLTYFGKQWKKMVRLREGNTLLIAGDDMIFHVDFSRGIIGLNPWHHEFRDLDLFSLYVRLFSKYYDINAELFDATLNWWILSIDLGSASSESANKILSSDLDKVFDALHLVAGKDSTILQVELVIEDGSSSATVGDLRDLFTLAKEAQGSK